MNSANVVITLAIVAVVADILLALLLLFYCHKLHKDSRDLIAARDDARAARRHYRNTVDDLIRKGKEVITLHEKDQEG